MQAWGGEAHRSHRAGPLALERRTRSTRVSASVLSLRSLTATKTAPMPLSVSSCALHPSCPKCAQELGVALCAGSPTAALPRAPQLRQDGHVAPSLRLSLSPVGYLGAPSVATQNGSPGANLSDLREVLQSPWWSGKLPEDSPEPLSVSRLSTRPVLLSPISGRMRATGTGPRCRTRPGESVLSPAQCSHWNLEG